MKTITVFTPSYNRAHLLGRLYESLLRQTNQDFIWLVVDDGSTDATHELVTGWQKEERIQIQYIFKANGGMHTAHNWAYKLIRTELNVCIDSDDWMPDNAVERILSVWSRYRNDLDVVGLIGLDVDLEGNTIGSGLPTDGTRSTLGELYQVHRCTGDKKLVYKSSVTASAPRFPEFEGERLVPLSWLYTQIDQIGYLVTMNEPLIVVEYQTEGSSANVLKQYFQSPRGFRALREVNIRYAVKPAYRIKNIIHYGFSSIVAQDWWGCMRSPTPWWSLLTFPVSVALYFWLSIRLRLVGRFRK
ncbi:MAG: glycosyltransferase family A protein [Pseudomonadota bacterium]